MPYNHYEILWNGIHFWVEAENYPDAAERVQKQLAADGIVIHAWQLRNASGQGDEATGESCCDRPTT